MSWIRKSVANSRAAVEARRVNKIKIDNSECSHEIVVFLIRGTIGLEFWRLNFVICPITIRETL